METTMTIITAAHGASLAALVGAGACLFAGVVAGVERESGLGLTHDATDATRGRAYPRTDALTDVPAVCRSQV